MPQQRDPGLSLAEWLVLCLVSEGPTHCFAIAGLLAEDGSLGRAQHERLAPVADGLAGQIRTTTGFDHVLTLWRHESISATLRFLDAVLATVPAQRASVPR